MRLATALVVLAGCTGDPSPDAGPNIVTSQGWTVTAVTPVFLSSETQVQGAMTLERQSGADTRGGGVCLVADLNDKHACNTAADCAALPLPTGGFHYCAGITGSPFKTCWTRPGGGDAFCSRGSSRTPGTYMTPPVPATLEQRPTTWMSYACMAVETNPMGCGSTDPGQSVSSTSLTIRGTKL